MSQNPGPQPYNRRILKPDVLGYAPFDDAQVSGSEVMPDHADPIHKRTMVNLQQQGSGKKKKVVKKKKAVKKKSVAKKKVASKKPKKKCVCKKPRKKSVSKKPKKKSVSKKPRKKSVGKKKTGRK